MKIEVSHTKKMLSGIWYHSLTANGSGVCDGGLPQNLKRRTNK